MKTKELIYIILDLCKIASDDAYFTEEHVQWLLSKNRSFLLKREQERLKLSMPHEDMQTICVDMQPVSGFNGDDCGILHIKSQSQIPQIISGTMPIVSTSSIFSGNISFVPFEKFKYVNFNKYLKNIIFACIGPDRYVYIKSSNGTFQYLQKIMLTGIFDDFEEAAKMSCDDGSGEQTCDPFEMEFPIEPYLVPELVDRVLREMLGGIWRGQDKKNDANDSLSDIANFIRQYMKKPLTNMIDGQEGE